MKTRFASATLIRTIWTSLAGWLLAAGLAQAAITIIPTNAVWRYLNDGSDQGTVWRAADFDDAGWAGGPAELGYGDAGDPEFRPEATVVPFGPDPNNKPITTYFRHAFNLPSLTSLTNVQVRLLRDDGAVVYLNGVEVVRSGMSPGLVNYLTTAEAPGTSGADEAMFFPFTIDHTLLVSGDNVIAVEVHQLTALSSDLSFALELVAITNPPPPVPPGAGLIVPTTLENLDVAYGAGTLRATGYRLQEVYGAIHFPPAPLVITELRYRPDSTHGFAFDTTIASIEIRLSTTTRQPDGLSATFANNVGEDETEVFSGVLEISSAFTGPEDGPKDFDIIIPLQTPFTYDPENGNLLVDIRNYSGSAASPLSGDGSPGDSASRVGGGVDSPTGGLDSGVDALMLVSTNGPPPAQPNRLTRGPYLQLGTTTNIVVRWRTSRPTNGIVQFGRTPGGLHWSITEPAPVTDHIVTLTNLLSDTKYFYAIGHTDVNLASGPEYYFTTAPTTAKPTRIWALGDCGTASQPGQTGALLVRDAYLEHTGSRETDVWLMLGDNAYSYGTDSEYQSAVFNTYQAGLRRWPLWSTLGNHETYAPQLGQKVAYWDIFNLPTQGEAGGEPSGTEKHYSFNYGNIHFVCLDSETAFTNNAGSDMLQWLEADLAANTNHWIIAFWHSPPYTKGSHNSDSFGDGNGNLFWMREQVVPILEAYGVDLVLNGHSHSYERSRFMHGHFGLSGTFAPSMVVQPGSGRADDTGPYVKAVTGPQAGLGTVYIVAGSSGWATFLQGDAPHEAMFNTQLELGSMVIDVDGDRLDSKFLREDGSIGDYFTIVKALPDAPVRFAFFQVNNGTITAQFSTVADRRYQVQKTPQLEAPVWTSIGDPFTATGPTTHWNAPAPAGSERFFFRVEELD